MVVRGKRNLVYKIFQCNNVDIGIGISNSGYWSDISMASLAQNAAVPMTVC